MPCSFAYSKETEKRAWRYPQDTVCSPLLFIYQFFTTVNSDNVTSCKGVTLHAQSFRSYSFASRSNRSMFGYDLHPVLTVYMLSSSSTPCTALTSSGPFASLVVITSASPVFQFLRNDSGTPLNHAKLSIESTASFPRFSPIT